MAHAHPAWCHGRRWHDKEADRDWGRPMHGASIGQGWLHQVLAKAGQVVLPYRGEWDVTAQQDGWSASHAEVHLDVRTDGVDLELTLQPGEAREMAAALTAAADLIGDCALWWPR